MKTGLSSTRALKALIVTALPFSLLFACSAAPLGQAADEEPKAAPKPSPAATADDPPPHPGGPKEPTDVVQSPGTLVDTVELPRADQEAFSRLSRRVAEAAKLDAAGLRAAFPSPLTEKLAYDPNTAEFLDRIQGSALALSDGERARLGENGFVISQRREFPTFLRGLAEIYAEHLPLYVTADALLASVHSSYDTILAQLEQRVLVAELRVLLRGMHDRLARSTADERTKKDTDLYLTVARRLLDTQSVAPLAGADPKRIETIVKQAVAATGLQQLELFGTSRHEDFSQFAPRGHYSGEPQLERYFRTMIWLGRIDFRLLETQSNGKQRFRREQYLSMLLMHELVGVDLSRFQRIDDVVRTFVGESDYMTLPEVAKLVDDLGGLAAARSASDSAVVSAIAAGGYGMQQIASHVMFNDGTVDTLPLNRSFALLGQRYVVDSHVFSEVVYDRLKSKRMMPSPLDAAFAALGNAHALKLSPDLDAYPDFPGALGRMRVAVDAHDQTFWDKNFYNLWLGALRALSPAAEAADANTPMPQVARTDAWGRRLLSVQLASWSELRHDTLLYAKQSYTGAPGCDFPDAYVDPYPAFYDALRKYAAGGSQISALIADVEPALATSIGDYFALLAQASSTLGDMAERQLRGEPFDVAQLAFINEAVRIEKKEEGCTTVEVPEGWYARLFYEPEKSLAFDPTIADVHTQPANEAGAIVGKVLHVGTGYPRMMVVTIDSCSGAPRAYAGVVYAYHEQVTEDFERLTDEDWAKRFQSGAPRPADVSWLEPVLAR